ncbi:MAG: hypothetical protein V1911_04400, partial [Candidatus Micrarchaeota archaeon]
MEINKVLFFISVPLSLFIWFLCARFAFRFFDVIALLFTIIVFFFVLNSAGGKAELAVIIGVIVVLFIGLMVLGELFVLFVKFIDKLSFGGGATQEDEYRHSKCRTHYDTLGVAQDAPFEVIKAA